MKENITDMEEGGWHEAKRKEITIR